jgi:hypothetical protein
MNAYDMKIPTTLPTDVFAPCNYRFSDNDCGVALRNTLSSAKRDCLVSVDRTLSAPGYVSCQANFTTKDDELS